MPGTRLLLVAGLRRDGRPGSIKLVDTRRRTWAIVYPRADADRPDHIAYPGCPGPPDPALFSTNGVALRQTGHARALFYALNHGGRQAVEIFALDNSVQPMWIGCIILPAHTNPNALAPLPDGGLAIVSMDDPLDRQRWEKHIAGIPAGSLFEWHPLQGLRQIPGVELRGGNGIVASRDGADLFISAWAGGEIVKIRRDGSRLPIVLKVPFLPDNLKWDAHGRILVAGQEPPVETIAHCSGDPCPDGWQIAELNPETMAIQTILTGGGNADFNYATGANELAGSLYLTGRGRDRIGIVAMNRLDSAR